jgi:hypothetical protein
LPYRFVLCFYQRANLEKKNDLQKKIENIIHFGNKATALAFYNQTTDNETDV